MQFFIFSKKIFFTKNLQISKLAKIGHDFMIFCLFHVYLGPNPIICKMWSLRWCSSRYFQYFSWVCHFFEKYYIPSGTRSSSRGVLTIRKVLPSKSMESQLSDAPSNGLVAILYQKLSHFEIQN